MKSFRDAVAFDAVTREVNPGPASSARDLAGVHDLAVPFSLSRLMLRLVPETIRKESGVLGPSTTTGSAELYVNSAGFWMLTGHMREDGFIGHSFAFGATLVGVNHPDGSPLLFMHKGQVDGGADPMGNRVHDWRDTGHDKLIAENWDTIKVRGVRFLLRVTTDPDEVVSALLGGVVIGGAAAGVVYLFASGKVKCDPPELIRDGQGQPGAQIRCRREEE